MIEGGSPNSLFKKGVTKQTVPIGSELVIDGYQARDGGPRAVGRNIAFADGRALFFSTTKPEGAPAQE
jgi:prepilin-type processing-associated H-X9-DG protein